MASSKKQIVSYDQNQEVIVRAKKQRIAGTFSAIGRLSTVHNRQKDDIFDRLAKVSKGAFKVFVELKRHRNDDTNLVHYPTSELPKTQREQFSRHLRELRDISLVRIAKRTMKSSVPSRPYTNPRQTYMIDPEALKCWNFNDAHLLWEQCKK